MRFWTRGRARIGGAGTEQINDTVTVDITPVRLFSYLTGCFHFRRVAISQDPGNINCIVDSQTAIKASAPKSQFGSAVVVFAMTCAVVIIAAAPKPAKLPLLTAFCRYSKCRFGANYSAGRMGSPRQVEEMMESIVTVSPVALLGGIGMIVVAFCFIGYAVVRRLGIKYLLLGAVAWVVTVAIKFAFAIPFNAPILGALTRLLSSNAGTIVFDLYVGVLTGMTEVLLVWLVMRYTRLGHVTWKSALSFGIGFGAVEALLLGVGSVATIVAAILAPQSIPSPALSQLAAANNPLLGLAPIVERVSTILVHIFANVLIFYGVARAQWRWFWLAFSMKSLLDAWAAFGQLSGMTATLEQIWVLEAGLVVFGILSAFGCWWIAHRYPAQAALSPDAPRPRWSGDASFASWGVLGLILFISLALAFVGGVQNPGLGVKEQENVLAYAESKTTNLLTALNQDDYASFSDDLSERMKSAFPKEKFEATRSLINGKIGNYVSRRVERVEQSGENVTVYYSARFEQDDPVSVRVSFTVAEPHSITGLWFDSPKLR